MAWKQLALSLEAEGQSPPSLTPAPSTEPSQEWEERAALLEFEGGLPRDEAERRAAVERRCRELFARQPWLAQACRLVEETLGLAVDWVKEDPARTADYDSAGRGVPGLE